MDFIKSHEQRTESKPYSFRSSKLLTYRAIVVCVLFSFFTVLFHCALGYTQDFQERLKAIEEQIKKYEDRLKKEQEKESSILKELERINSELADLKKRLDNQYARLRSTEQKLSRTQAEVKDLETRLQKRKEWLKKKLRHLWIFGYTREMEFLITSRDGGEFLRNWRYLTRLGVYDKRAIERLRQDIETLKAKEIELSQLRRDIKKTLASIEEEELNLLKTRKEKAVLLTTVKQNKEHYKRMLAELNESAKRLAKIIEESRTKGDSKSDNLFLSKRGRLSWPVNGRIKIPFGYQKDPVTGLPVFRSGIFILTEDYAPVKAVLEGKVAYTGRLKGYGNILIISHGSNYHTVYANLSEIFFKPGDIILKEQVIGKTGESEIMEGTGLYFEIRYKGKPLDPLHWLKKEKTH